MADEIETPGTEAEQQSPKQQEPAWLPERLERARAQEREKFADYDDLRAKAEEFDKLQEAAKSDLQKATERAEQAERRAQEAETSALRQSVAADKGVPLNLIHGTTREEMEAAADEALSWRGQAAASGSLNPRGGFYSGASGTAPTPSDPKSQAAAALRELRNSR